MAEKPTKGGSDGPAKTGPAVPEFPRDTDDQISAIRSAEYWEGQIMAADDPCKIFAARLRIYAANYDTLRIHTGKFVVILEDSLLPMVFGDKTEASEYAQSHSMDTLPLIHPISEGGIQTNCVYQPSFVLPSNPSVSMSAMIKIGEKRVSGLTMESTIIPTNLFDGPDAIARAADPDYFKPKTYGEVMETIDEMARAGLEMSGEEFIEMYRRGEIDNPQEDPILQYLIGLARVIDKASRFDLFYPDRSPKKRRRFFPF